MLSLIVFIAAIMIFIGLFGQNIQGALTYQRHQALSTKTSDLLDNILLSPGSPTNWGTNDTFPACFGLQNPVFTQYQLSPFSLMRLSSSLSQSVTYRGASYTNISTGPGCCVLLPSDKLVNYSNASKLLGTSSTYGFQFSLSPLLTVSTEKVSTGSPLKIQVNVVGSGFPLAGATLSYSLFLVNNNGNSSYTVYSNTTVVDQTGSAQLIFSGINGETRTYALIVYAYLNGLKGMGYYVHTPDSFALGVVPMITSFANRTVMVAHSDSFAGSFYASQLNYNASFVILSTDNTLRQIQLAPSEATGALFYGHDYSSLTLPDNYGILIVTYTNPVDGQCGVVLMPWGLNALSYPLIFGGNSQGQEWVATDVRQVTIGGISYQAKLALWNINYQVSG